MATIVNIIKKLTILKNCLNLLDVMVDSIADMFPFLIAFFQWDRLEEEKKLSNQIKSLCCTLILILFTTDLQLSMNKHIKYNNS